jgi:tetratricopeptide (TPR) repeat protein
MAQRDKTVDDGTVTEHLRKSAEDCVRAGCYDEAIVLYQKLVERYPDEDSLMLALAWACHDGGHIEEAVAWFEKLFDRELSRRVFTGFAFDELVRIFKRQGQYDRLLGICLRAVAAQPDDYALLGDLGDAYLKTDQPQKAVSVFRQMTEMEPGDAMAFCLLGNALIALRDFPGAEEAYGRATAIDSDKEGAYYCRLAEEYRRASHLERAEQAIRRSLVKEATEPAYHLFLGDVLIEGGHVTEGWMAYESAVHLRPGFSGAYYYRLGNTLKDALQHESAILAFQKAIAADPGVPLYVLHLAETFAATGREDLAQEALRHAELLL